MTRNCIQTHASTLAEHHGQTGLRIRAAASEGGRLGFEVLPARNPTGEDEVFAAAGTRVFIDQQAAACFRGKILDPTVVGNHVRFKLVEER
jgi:Fe-S cluster assembly iron-binding protein IscA